MLNNTKLFVLLLLTVILSGVTLAKDAFSLVFSDENSLTVELNDSQRVELDLYDLAGRRVETIHQGSLSEGRHGISYDTVGITGGLYLLHLDTNEATETIRLAIVR